MFRAAAFIIAQLVYANNLRCGLDNEWNNLQRTVHESGYRDMELQPVSSYAELTLRLDGLTWTGDGLSRGFDTTSDPRRVQDILNTGRVAPDVDCDDFASYSVAVLNLKHPEDLIHASFLSVAWQQADSVWVAGHAVTLLKRKGGWSYMDYGGPSDLRGTVAEVVEDVRRGYAKGGRLMLYSLAEVDPRTYGMKDTRVFYPEI